MPKFLEDNLKAEYGQNSKIPYMVMNKIGAMRGNKETAKGRAMERKHEQKMTMKGAEERARPRKAMRKIKEHGYGG